MVFSCSANKLKIPVETNSKSWIARVGGFSTQNNPGILPTKQNIIEYKQITQLLSSRTDLRVILESALKKELANAKKIPHVEIKSRWI
jgi:hypothetical protein